MLRCLFYQKIANKTYVKTDKNLQLNIQKLYDISKFTTNFTQLNMQPLPIINTFIIITYYFDSLNFIRIIWNRMHVYISNVFNQTYISGLKLIVYRSIRSVC